MKTVEEINEEIKKINKEIDKNSSPLYGLALMERKNTLLWVLEDSEDVENN